MPGNGKPLIYARRKLKVKSIHGKIVKSVTRFQQANWFLAPRESRPGIQPFSRRMWESLALLGWLVASDACRAV